MRKDDSGIHEWALHTRRGPSNNIVNKTNRRKVKNAIKKGKEESLRSNSR